MAKDLTNSIIDRQNILNNDLAIEEIKKNINVPGIYIDDKIYFTVEYVASFYEVDRYEKRFRPRASARKTLVGLRGNLLPQFGKNVV